MRVHLTFNDDMYRAGYVNVDRFPRNEHQREGDVFHLDWLLDAGEASEIVASYVLDRLGFDRIRDVVEGWSNCLAPGGILTIVGTDLYTIINKVATRRMSIGEANHLIYGRANSKDRMYSTSTVKDTEDLMRFLGLRVIESRYQNDSYVVKGQRP